jgi:hypothetical protein
VDEGSEHVFPDTGLSEDQNRQRAGGGFGSQVPRNEHLAVVHQESIVLARLLAPFPCRASKLDQHRPDSQRVARR